MIMGSILPNSTPVSNREWVPFMWDPLLLESIVGRIEPNSIALINKLLSFAIYDRFFASILGSKLRLTFPKAVYAHVKLTLLIN